VVMGRRLSLDRIVLSVLGDRATSVPMSVFIVY